MVTVSNLHSQTSKALAQLAKKKGILGWHSMRKQQLITALEKTAKGKRASRPQKDNLDSKPDSAIARKIKADRQRQENLKNLGFISNAAGRQQLPKTDRLVLVVRDSYWLQAYWEITQSTVKRAKVALYGHWHQAKPLLRLFAVNEEHDSHDREKLIQETEIHGGVNNWYLHLNQQGSFRAEIGYATPDGKFHLISKSNRVTPPTTKTTAIDENWTDISSDADKFYALSGGLDDSRNTKDLYSVLETKSQRPLQNQTLQHLSVNGSLNKQELTFQVDAHLIVHGNADTDCNISVAGEKIQMESNGSFSVKIDLQERRQVIPVIVSKKNGSRQRTTVLAIERNTKLMDEVSNELSL